MNRSSLTQIFGGLVILVVGLIILLHNTNIVNAGTLINDWWPMLIVLAGVLVFINNIRSWLVALFLVLLGGTFELKELGYITFSPWQVILPLLLIFFGASMMFRRSFQGNRVSKADREDVTAILAGSYSTNTSQKFKASNATAIMGGARLDLRSAKLDKEANIEVFTFWGGVEIIVPKNVIVKNKVVNILGGTDDKTAQEVTKDSPELTITGEVIMGGVAIRNTPYEN